MIAEAFRFAKACAALLAVALGACGGPDLDHLAEGERGRVALVRSGHTLVLEDGLVVRLAGMEAPLPDEPYGVEARERLADLTVGREVRLLYGGERRDGYDRAVAHVRVLKGRKWVQGEMLASGAARVRTWPDNRALAREMYPLEADARRKGLGLWALPEHRVLLPDEATDAGRGFHVVEGRVTRAYEGWRGATLELEGREGFQVAVQGRAERDFEAAGLDPLALEGRLVRVRGWLSGGRGSLRLDHPEQIERLREPGRR